jgi:hypothetical protein
MVGMGVLAALVVVVLIVALARRPGGQGARPPRPHEPPISAGLLDDAVAAGVLAREHADALRAFAAETAEHAPRRSSVTAEVLGYLGGVLVLVGALSLVSQFWDDLAAWSRLALVGGVTTVLTGAGLLVRPESDPVRWRLRGFLWLLASGGVALFAGLLGADVLEWQPRQVALLVGGSTAVHAGVLWERQNRPAQQLACFGGLVAATAAGGAVVDGPAAAGLALCALGAAWVVLAWHELVPPRQVALVLGPALVLVGAGVTAGSWPDVAPILGLGTALVLVALGSRGQEFLLTGIGVAGVFVYIPWIATHFFADTVGVPIVLLVTGAMLLAFALVLLRRRGDLAGPPPRPA